MNIYSLVIVHSVSLKRCGFNGCCLIYVRLCRVSLGGSAVRLRVLWQTFVKHGLRRHLVPVFLLPASARTSGPIVDLAKFYLLACCNTSNA